MRTVSVGETASFLSVSGRLVTGMVTAVVPSDLGLLVEVCPTGGVLCYAAAPEVWRPRTFT